jgi:uncharacterized membrane protein YdfJ with MMPL/SSD domain
MSLRALARLCYRRRRLVVTLWLAALIGINVLAASLGTNFSTNFSAPNTESTRASNLLAANFKAESGDAVQVVMKGSPSMRDAAVEQQAQSFIAALENVPHVAGVSNPFATPGGISKSGTIALANAQLDARSQDVPNSVGRQMINLAEKHSTPQLEVRLGGQLIQQAERPSLSGEGIGLIAAILILLIAFGSVLAMVLPILVALAGIAVGLAIIGLLTHVYPLQSFCTRRRPRGRYASPGRQFLNTSGACSRSASRAIATAVPSRLCLVSLRLPDQSITFRLKRHSSSGTETVVEPRSGSSTRYS